MARELGKVREVVLLGSAARTTSGNSAGDDFGLNYDEAQFFLDVTAASGTSPTLDAIIQVSPDEGVTWYDLATFTQAVAVTAQMLRELNIGSRLRVAWTIGGTSPSFTFEVRAVFKRRGKE